MKSALTLVMVLACASALHAGDMENIKRTAAFENYAIDIKAAIGSISIAAPNPAVAWPKEDFTLRRDFCWIRGKDSNAERLGMAYSFCINSLEVTAGIRDNPRLIVKGDVISGTFDLKISPPGDGLYRATAVIFKREPMIQVCAPAEAAYIELNLLIDERGKIVADPGTKSFYGATEDTCGSPWKYSEIKYVIKDA